MPDNNGSNKNVNDAPGSKKGNGQTPSKSRSKDTGSSNSRDISSSSDVIFYEAPPKDISSTSTRRIPKVTSPSPVQKKKKGNSSIALRICAAVLGAVMMICGSGCLVYYSVMGRINYESIGGESSVASNSSAVLPSKPGTTSGTNVYEGTLLNDSEILNILLMGADTRANQEHGNSDTMILMSIDTRHKKLKLTSFMRDTYVAIPGYEDNKLNAAFNLGGIGLTVRTIQANFGIEIDRYAVVDFSSFRNIIDVLGGIDVDLTSDEIDYINWQFWINEQDEYKYADEEYKDSVREQLMQVWFATVPDYAKPINKTELNFRMNEDGEAVATVHLSGRPALWHARNRGENGICSGDDYVRTQRQRDVLGVIVNKLKSSDLSTVMSIIYEIGPMITTNLKTTEITALATNILKYLNYDMVNTSAPTRESLGTDYYFSDEEHPIYIYGYLQSCIVISDWENFRLKVADFVFGDKVSFNDEISSDESSSYYDMSSQTESSQSYNYYDSSGQSSEQYTEYSTFTGTGYDNGDDNDDNYGGYDNNWYDNSNNNYYNYDGNDYNYGGNGNDNDYNYDGGDGNDNDYNYDGGDENNNDYDNGVYYGYDY